jgi:hypothetical protein
MRPAFPPYYVLPRGPARSEFSLWIYRPVKKPRNPACSVRVQINDPWLEGRYLFAAPSHIPRP